MLVKALRRLLDLPAHSALERNDLLPSSKRVLSSLLGHLNPLGSFNRTFPSSQECRMDGAVQPQLVLQWVAGAPRARKILFNFSRPLRHSVRLLYPATNFLR
jgi:hypothetical protein